MALEAAREGLKRECRIVLPPPSLNAVQAHLDKVGPLRQLGRLMGARARLAELEGRWGDLVQSSLDVIEAANRGSRGGLMIDTLAGFAIESGGLSILLRERDQLSGEQCRDVVDALEAIDKGREPTSKVAGRDRAWSTAGYHFFARAALALSPPANKLFQASVNSFESSRRRTDARLRLAIVAVALRCYRLDHGTDAASLNALVPVYLDQVPDDPYSGQPIRYHLEPGTGYRLYCVGPDRIDDGGKPFPERSDWITVRGDVLVDPQ
jgi:hypothetical protein